jgi:hypothetical protein
VTCFFPFVFHLALRAVLSEAYFSAARTFCRTAAGDGG